MTKLIDWICTIDTVLVITAFGALANFFVALIALRNAKKYYDPRPILSLTLGCEDGELGEWESKDQDATIRHVAWFYHLTVTNRSQKVSANNCAVALRRRVIVESNQPCPENEREKPVRYPLYLVNAPNKGKTLMTVNCDSFQAVEFGFCEEGKPIFMFGSDKISVPEELNCHISEGETKRFYFRIEADNYSLRTEYGFEIFWNGKWSKDKNEMRKNVKIKGLPPVIKGWSPCAIFHRIGQIPHVVMRYAIPKK